MSVANVRASAAERTTAPTARANPRLLERSSYAHNSAPRGLGGSGFLIDRAGPGMPASITRAHDGKPDGSAITARPAITKMIAARTPAPANRDMSHPAGISRKLEQPGRWDKRL